jgi:hypothetical protein
MATAMDMDTVATIMDAEREHHPNNEGRKKQHMSKKCNFNNDKNIPEFRLKKLLLLSSTFHLWVSFHSFQQLLYVQIPPL